MCASRGGCVVSSPCGCARRLLGMLVEAWRRWERSCAFECIYPADADNLSPGQASDVAHALHFALNPSQIVYR